MPNVIVQLIPMMIGAAVVPFCLFIVLLLLRSQDGLFKAVAFVAGQILVRLLQGIGFGLELGFSRLAQTREGSCAIISTLLLVAGILLCITAFKSWANQEDPDTPPPRWLGMVSSLSRLKAFGLGIVSVAGGGKQWIFTLYAVGVIHESNLPLRENAIAFLMFVLGAQSLVFLPIGLYAITPNHAAHLLEAGTLWLERNNQKLLIAVSCVFGAFFTLKGLAGLLR